MGLIYSVSVLFFTFMIFRMYLKKDIMEYCGSRIRCSFGIGTNDTGFKPANIVMKLISCQMNVNQPVYGCVKLSDDKGKHTGEMREVKSCLSELGL